MKLPPVKPQQAFTLLELVVVLAVIAAMLLTVFPALTKTNPNVSTMQCLNNSRQLAVAWRMYAEDNRDYLIYCSENPINNASQYSWVRGYLDFDPSNPANYDANTMFGGSPFYSYTGKNPAIYKCPSDRSTVVVAGTARPRIRTMTMNYYVGGFEGGISPGYSYYHLLSEVNGRVHTPGPAKLWVFLEIRPDASDFSNFLVDMSGYSPSNPSAYGIYDFPGFYHNQGCNLSFADGHGETHKWVDPRTTPPLGSMGSGGSHIASPRNLDVGWLQDHSTRPK